MNKLYEYLRKVINGKKIAILGFGREGKATLKALLEVGGYECIAVIDSRDVTKEVSKECRVIFGSDYQDSLNDFDLVFKSPGIVLNKPIEDYSCNITSEMEAFLSCYGSNVCGITGTKGKSTTSSLIYNILKRAGRDCFLAGNIGVPVFEFADKVNPDTIAVIEMSCHQLEYLKVSPHVAILLNIYEDHLDHYGTREKYGLAKKNIYINQCESDFLFTTKETLDEWGMGESNTKFVSKEALPFKSFDELDGVSLRGEHNLLNAAFAYEACRLYGITDSEFVKGVCTFKTLPHRLESIGVIDGVEYIDDSISTTVNSTICAIESIENAKIVLVGGMERNIEYEGLVEYLANSRLKLIICMYESGKRIYSMYADKEKEESSPKALLCTDLGEAVRLAKENACAKEAVLLSPAAASYGYFKNFEERGDRFKELIMKN